MRSWTPPILAMEEIIDIHYTLHMLGIPLDRPAWLLSDNQAAINALSYHWCREAVAASSVCFKFFPGHDSPSDILTKTVP